MSRDIDQRIVEMQFNNRQFESGIQTSIKSLDDLKNSLKLEDATRGLTKLSSAAKDLSFAGLANNVDTIASKFSTLGIVGVTALQNITNSAVNAGKKLISSLTIDPIKTGLTEYETKMDSIQTILSNTKANGTTLDDVNKALADLNTYSDKTIYNFAQMTDMVGKFAAKSGELDSSVSIVKGLANLAATSGVDNTRLQGALYQVSQMAETVKSLDWMSIDTAGLGTVKFKDDLIAMAQTMGTIDTKTLKDLQSGMVSFRDTLKDGWLTKDVFNSVTSMYALDEAMTKTAGEVTTFTKLFSVMAESVQSGWGTSWEKIIGDKDQSTQMLTSLNNAFGNLIAPSTNARNAMLDFWNVNGGRDAIIEALTNSFKALQSILGPIIKGFKEVFPPMTGERLVEISTAIRDITRNFKVSDETAEELKATFKGFFALISIGVQAISALGNGLLSILKIFFPIGDGILSVTSYIGYFLVGLNKTIKTTDAFNISISKVVDFIKTFAKAIGNVLYDIGNIIGIFASSTFKSGVDNVSGFVGDASDGFSTLWLKIKNVVTALNEFKNSLKESVNSKIVKPLSDMWSKFSGGSETLSKLKENMSNFFKSIDLEDVLAVVSTGAFTAFFLKLRKVASDGGEVLEHIIGVLDEVKNTLKAYQTELKAGALIKIASAIAILAGSLLVLSFIDPKKIGPAIAAITALFVDLFGALAGFEKVVGDKSTASIMGISVALIGLSTALFVLSGVMKRLAELDPSGIAKGLTSIVVLSATMVGVSMLLSKNEGSMMKSSLGLNAFASAMYILVGVMERIGSMDPEKLGQGIVGLGLVIGTLAILLNSKQMKSMSIQSGVGLIGIATAMMILSSAVQSFGDIDSDKMQQGVIGIGSLMAILATFIKISGNAENVVAIGISLIAISAAMLVLSKAVDDFGSLDLDVIGKGLLTLAGALTIIAAATRAMPSDILVKSAALVVMSVALLGLSAVLDVLGKFKMEEIGKSLLLLAGSLGVIAGAMLLMQNAIPGAAALVIIVGALTLFIPTLLLLGAMPLQNIGVGLLALAGAFAVLGVAALVLAPLTPVILALGAGITLISVGFMAAGAGLLFFASGLTALAASGYAGAQALGVVMKTVCELIPFAIQKVGEGLVLFAQIIINNIPTLMTAFSVLFLALLTVIKDSIPTLVDALVVFIEKLLKTISEHLPAIVESGWQIVKSFLKGIADHIQEVVEIGIDIVVAFLNGVSNKLPDIIQAAFNLIISFIDGLADAIKQNTPRIVAVIKKLIKSLMDAAVYVMKGATADFKKAGSNIIQKFKEAIQDKISDVVETITSIPKKALEGLKNSVDSFFEAGSDVVNGFVNGIKNAIGGVVDAGANIGESVINAAKDVLDIHSPSGIFEWIGNMVDIGKADGIDKMANVPADAAANMAQGSIDAASSVANEKTGAQIGTNMTNGVSKGIQNGTPKVAKSAAEMAKEAFDKSVEWIDEKKYYNQLSLEQELAAWQRVQSRYLAGTEERKKADREVYRVKQELIKAAEDAEQKSFDHSVAWIDEKKYYNQLSLGEELAAWERVQSRYIAGSEERKKADREVYRVKQELASKQKEIDDEYYSKQKELNDKLISDVKALNDAYDQAVESRTKSLYSTYGLFDKVGEQEVISGSDLVSNLQEQVNEFDNWQKNIADLANKGIDQGLIKELTEMGPKALTQIQALNTLSDDELKKYVSLWQTKSSEARTQAISELEGMRIDTQSKIAQLNSQLTSDLETLKITCSAKVAALTGSISTDFSDMNTDVSNSTSSLSTNVTNNFTKMQTDSSKNATALQSSVSYAFSKMSADVTVTVTSLRTKLNTQFATIIEDIKKAFSSQDWSSIGANIVLGMSAGVKANAASLANESAATALMALNSAKKALGIHSPSKEFEQLGIYSDLGFINGLRKMSGSVATEGGNVGTTAISSLKDAISNISEVVSSDIDMNPTIRPVLDLSDVESGKRKLGTLFGARQGLNVSSTTNKASIATISSKTESAQNNQNGTDINSGKSIQFVQNNYSPKALSRLDIYRQTKNQFSAMKGVVSDI